MKPCPCLFRRKELRFYFQTLTLSLVMCCMLYYGRVQTGRENVYVRGNKSLVIKMPQEKKEIYTSESVSVPGKFWQKHIKHEK